MPDESSHGPPVADDEHLLRGILRAEWWDSESGHLSSAIFGFPRFSAFIASMRSEEELLQRFRPGSGIVRFHCGTARLLGFDARHEPEQGDDAHANVYCNLKSSQRKRHARMLVESAQVTRVPERDLLDRSD
jgi:hypothetical protein